MLFIQAMMQQPNNSTRWSPPVPPRRQAPPVFSRPASRQPDLHSQLEDLLDAVWTAEDNWRFDDRLDIALGLRRI